jgi:methyl-coenzyme M reductase gamma subunit
MRKENLYPGNDRVAERRRFLLDKESKFKKLRAISDEDLINILGHRAAGEKYSSLHPSLDELKFEEDPIKELVPPTEGAKEGDRIRYIQFTDSVYHSPLTPTFRGRMYHVRYRGMDTLAYSGRELMEARERDLEKYARELIETEVFDPARTALRGVTVHGSALRLDEDGLMFDARRRCVYDKDKKAVVYVKNQVAVPLDKTIDICSPLPEEELIKKSLVYGLDTIPYREARELSEVNARLLETNVKGGLNPELVEKKE